MHSEIVNFQVINTSARMTKRDKRSSLDFMFFIHKRTRTFRVSPTLLLFLFLLLFLLDCLTILELPHIGEEVKQGKTLVPFDHSRDSGGHSGAPCLVSKPNCASYYLCILGEAPQLLSA
jgi:hypothetical protein